MVKSKIVEVRKVKLGPLKCYLEAKDFLGDQYWLFLGMCWVSLIISGFVPLLLIGPAYAGIAVCFLAKANKEQVVFDQVFKGFDYFGPSLIASLIYVGGVMVLYIPFMVAVMAGVLMLSSQETVLIAPAILILVTAMSFLTLVIAFASMVFMFSILLIVDKKMEGWPAVKLAFKGAWKNLMGIIGTASAGQAIYCIAAMMCVIPAILVLPIIFGGHFIAYWKIFGVEALPVVVGKPVDSPYGRQGY